MTCVNFFWYSGVSRYWRETEHPLPIRIFVALLALAAGIATYALSGVLGPDKVDTLAVGFYLIAILVAEYRRMKAPAIKPPSDAEKNR